MPAWYKNRRTLVCLAKKIRNIDLTFVQMNHIIQLNQQYLVDAVGGLMIPDFYKKVVELVKSYNIINVNSVEKFHTTAEHRGNLL